VKPEAHSARDGSTAFKLLKPLTVSVRITRLNPLTPNVHYSGRTAPVTSRRCILNIYSKNIRTEYFKHAA
jgi:hypothetical protein